MNLVERDPKAAAAAANKAPSTGIVIVAVEGGFQSSS
jgi:hypothetical protein